MSRVNLRSAEYEWKPFCLQHLKMAKWRWKTSKWLPLTTGVNRREVLNSHPHYFSTSSTLYLSTNAKLMKSYLLTIPLWTGGHSTAHYCSSHTPRTRITACLFPPWICKCVGMWFQMWLRSVAPCYTSQKLARKATTLKPDRFQPVTVQRNAKQHLVPHLAR